MKTIDIDIFKVIKQKLKVADKEDIKTGQYVRIVKNPDGWITVPPKDEYGKVVHTREGDFIIDCIGSDKLYIFSWSVLENFKHKGNADYNYYIIPVTADEVMIENL